MKVRSIVPWFGGKRSLASQIVAELGPHAQYFEPFCGSMAVLLAKPPAKQETVNDLHGDLVNLARVLQMESSAHQLYEMLQRTLVCETILQDARQELEHGDGPPLTDLACMAPTTHACIDRAYWYFVASWMGRNGAAGMERTEFQLAVRWTAGGGSPTVRWRSAIESLPGWHQRLTNVVILQRDAFAIIPKFEDAEHTAIYVDPPYVAESRSHGRYKHDFDSRPAGLFGDDHSRLAEMLRELKRARVVVSYYDSPRVRKLYAGWRFVECGRQKNLHCQNGRGSRKAEAPEVLIVNGSAMERNSP